MAGDFPGDYCPFGTDVVVLIESFGVVQLFGKRRKPDSHACFASLSLAQTLLRIIIAARMLLTADGTQRSINRTVSPLEFIVLCDNDIQFNRCSLYMQSTHLADSGEAAP